jgi:pantoate--beta-alanine ligase
MTMGALHAGHRALIEAAADVARSVVVTIFVNPLQFGPGEDFDRYPRSLPADVELCRKAGGSLVFAPGIDEVFPAGEPQIRINAGRLGAQFEGAARPGHFDGVLTIVTKLLHLTRPDIAVFGEKDAQQLSLIRRLVVDLDLPVTVHGVPIVRDPDGLALSSRNAYLSAADRAVALAIPRALRAGTAAAPHGVARVQAAAQAELDREPRIDIDYVAVVDDTDFTDLPDHAHGPARLLIAASVSKTRLIDNAPVVLG